MWKLNLGNAGRETAPRVPVRQLSAEETAAFRDLATRRDCDCAPRDIPSFRISTRSKDEERRGDYLDFELLLSGTTATEFAALD